MYVTGITPGLRALGFDETGSSSYDSPCRFSQSGGIGRRAGLKIPWPSGRVGSTPTSGTRSPALRGFCLAEAVPSVRNSCFAEAARFVKFLYRALPSNTHTWKSKVR